MESAQIVVLAGVSVLALVNLATLVWVYHLNRRASGKVADKHYTIHLDGNKYFADLDTAEVKSLVHDKLLTSTAKAAKQFETALNKAIPKLVSDIDDINTKAMQKEFEKFQANIQALSAQAMQDQFRLQQDVGERRVELMDALDKEVVKQYQKRMEGFDKRLSDVVSSYVVETLGQQADLGAQMPYLLKQLEANKAQIKEDMK